MREQDILSRQLVREKAARKEAEKIAETKSRILYQANRELSVRNEIISLLAEYSSLDEITPHILKIICKTMQLELGALWKVDLVNKVLRCVDTWSVESDKIKEFANVSSNQFTFLLGVGLPGRVWESKAPCWIEDVTKDLNFPRADWAERAGLHAGFAFPIHFEGEVLAVVEFFMNHFYSFDDSLMRFLNDITNQIGIYIGREQAQKRVASLSRLVGMEDVASNVLHNVGNVLNSINTSVDMLGEKIVHSSMEKLTPLVELLHQHKNDIRAFLLNDPKGIHALEFLSLLSKEWVNEKKYLSNEIILLKKNIGHVNSIISMQQSLTRVAGIAEKISLPELLDDAVTLSKITENGADIKINREFHTIKKIIIDKVKLYQIIVNLVKNAIDSLLESNVELKQLTLRFEEKDNFHFMVKVCDNGLGILPENITKIFSHGFTTKRKGHGFGLHSSAIYAHEMGGSLVAESRGIGSGATFTLILPYQVMSDSSCTDFSSRNSNSPVVKGSL